MSDKPKPTSEKLDKLVESFKKDIENNPNSSIGIAVIRVLTACINESTATTFMGVDQEIMQLIDSIQNACPNLPLHFQGAAKVFRAGMSKSSELKSVNWKTLFVSHANACLDEANEVLTRIPSVSVEFLPHGMTILTRGFDYMVSQVLMTAASSGRQFHVIITEGRPYDDGCKLASSLIHQNLKVTIIPDSSVGLWMSEADVCLVGTDIVLESGGLLAPCGTYSMCVLASIHKKPVYCVCETFKFMRKFILGVTDLQENQRSVPYKAAGVDNDHVECVGKEFDYTPAKFVTLLLTEKGAMPPSAVTHELTKLLGVS